MASLLDWLHRSKRVKSRGFEPYWIARQRDRAVSWCGRIKSQRANLCLGRVLVRTWRETKMKKQAKFGIGIGIIVVALGFLAWLGCGEGKTYYHTSAELHALHSAARAPRMRWGG